MVRTRIETLSDGNQKLTFGGVSEKGQLTIGFIVGTERGGQAILRGDKMVGCVACPETIADIVKDLKANRIN